MVQQVKIVFLIVATQHLIHGKMLHVKNYVKMDRNQNFIKQNLTEEFLALKILKKNYMRMDH